MSAMIGGSVSISGTVPDNWSPTEYRYIFDRDSLTPDDLVEYQVRIAEARKKQEEEREQRLVQLRRYPVDGLSGEFRDIGGKYSSPQTMEVWREGSEGKFDDSLTFVYGQCVLCDSEGHMLLVGYEDHDAFQVCSACIQKMFDAFWKKVSG